MIRAKHLERVKMKHGYRNELVTFYGPDGRFYRGLASTRRNGLVQVDYFQDLEAGQSRHLRELLDRHEAKARVAPVQKGA